jgi:hypothetical protein
MLNGGELDRRNASCILWNCADRNKLLRCTDHQPKQNDGQPIATMLACGTTVVDAQISSVEPQSHTTYASRMLNCDRM